MKKLLFIASIGLLFSCSNHPTPTYKVGETLIFNDLEIMSEDLDDMLWINATEACKKLGEGWRLPTKDELLLIRENKKQIGGFHGAHYWSSTEHPNNDDWACYVSFKEGNIVCLTKKVAKSVRAVRNNKRN